ncbi:Tlg2-vesicle protein [Cladophialophora chaetospira]|uniref:Golgi apparatus membrane protein TVP38 n=1 Tax=Cladophialophora chaetospira TaxID=386627 RepID=A0AA38XIF2_9EURO|nr:Tlg2-vesicle protein [Cladophialophora chaetospira]
MAVNPVSLPDSDDESPRPGLLSPWRPPRRSLSSGGRSSPFAQSRSAAWRDELINNTEKLRRRIHKVWSRMTFLQKILTCVGLVALNVLGILFLVFNERIFGWLEPLAERWKNTTGGWTILWAIVFLCAFPPVIGYSTAATTAGFVYGVWEGWLILATATVAGSVCSFIVSRSILRKWVERLTANDKRFAALSLILKHDGLKLLAMIRLCPLPYSLSNGAMSTFPTVTPAAYALATAMVTPKLLVPAFIGSRLAVIARTREKMTMGDRAINYSSIVLGAVIGTGTAYYIYRQTMARARELEAEEVNNVRDSTRRTGHPPPEFSDDPEAQVAANTVARDDDRIDYFDDSVNEQGEYRDETDEDDDVFGKGDGDELATANINLHQQRK